MKSQKLLLPLLVFLLLLNFSCVHRKERREPIHGGCCLSQGTLVRLSNGKDKLIENLKAGDTVLAYDRTKNEFVSSRVVKMFQTEHAGFVKLNFAALYRNGVTVFDPMSIIISNDHPVWVKEKGWCSLEPEMTKRIQMLKDVKKLEVNDYCYTNRDLSMEGFAGNAMLASIEKIKEPVRAYSIVQLENKLDCFIANGIVVGTEAMTMESGGD
jgi:hypothetical protein